LIHAVMRVIRRVPVMRVILRTPVMRVILRTPVMRVILRTPVMRVIRRMPVMRVIRRTPVMRTGAPLTRLAVPVAAFVATAGAVVSVLPSSAAASPTTPPSTVSCGGTITPDAGGPAAGNANAYDYAFSCTPSLSGATDPSGYSWNFSGNIWSYTILVTRRNDDGNNVTYEAPTANVLNSSGALDTTQYVNCSSSVPSDGFGCSAPGPGASSASDLANGSNPPYLSYIPAGETVTGGFALTQGYCSFVPKGAKPGTAAVPQATVELIVTDTNGVSEGPFELTRTGKCPKVPAVVPERKKKTKNKTKKHVKTA
jgi:hypothetical protein